MYLALKVLQNERILMVPIRTSVHVPVVGDDNLVLPRLAMSDLRTVYLFGDDVQVVSRELAMLLRVKNDAVLTSFLEQTYRALRAHIGLLPQTVQDELPRFRSIAELNLLGRRGGMHPALRQALLCIQQFGSFIR